MRFHHLCLLGLLLASGCKKEEAPNPPAQGGAKAPVAATPPAAQSIKVGIVTGVGGRGDQSFNDSALRGLELWSAGKKYVANGYQDATAQEVKESLPPDLSQRNPPSRPWASLRWSWRPRPRRTSRPISNCWWIRASHSRPVWGSCWRARWRSSRSATRMPGSCSSTASC
ncbi:hypothetical protein ACN28S_59830 [Cystobacter fuscus]